MPTIYKPKKKYKREVTERREERSDIYNTPQWKKLRNAKYIENPLCEICMSKGIVKPAEHIHHIISFMTTDNMLRRMELAFDYSNLQSLCTDCHTEIHNHKKNRRIV
jgi:5-methylcytosine-specific restriction protein A